MADKTIEQRLLTLEEKVAGLLKHDNPAAGERWWEEWLGAFKDNPGFDAAMTRGAEYRRSQPTAEDGPSADVSS